MGEDFEELRCDPRFASVLRDLDISDDDQFFLFETLDADGSGTIDLTELLDGIARLRGEARRSDIVALNLTLNSVQHELKQHISETINALREIRHSVAVRSQSLRVANNEGAFSTDLAAF